MSKKLSGNRMWVLRVLLCTLVFFTPYSCRKKTVLKEELAGDKAMLIGRWNWINTVHDYGWCDGESYTETLNPLTENINFCIEFFNPGIIFIYKNDSLISEYRIFFEQFEVASYDLLVSNQIDFVIDIVNSDEMSNMGGAMNSDTLISGTFPCFIFASESGCENYQNYFIKE